MRTTTTFEDRVRQVWETDHERLWRALLAWSGNAEVASDAAAEAYAQVLLRGEVVRDPAAWVWRAAFRIASGILDASRTSSTLDSMPIIECSRSAAGESLVLVDALAELSDLDRRIVVLKLVAGWSSTEIGHEEGLTAGSVRVRLHRARRHLQKNLEQTHD